MLESFKLKFTDAEKLLTVEKSQAIDLKDLMEDGEDWEEYSMAALPRYSSLFIKSID